MKSSPYPGLHRLPLRILVATRCQLNNDSISASFDNRVATTDDSLGVGSGGAGATDAAQSASSAYGTATTAKDDAIVQGGSFNKNVVGINNDQFGTLNTGGFAQGGSGNKVENSTITVGYTAGDFQTALQTVGSNLTNALNAQAATGAEQANKALQRISELAETKQTEGDSSRNKIVLYVVLGVLALLGWIFYRK